jgi:D-tyrosyl-tRNA(Tyr) deacylase
MRVVLQRVSRASVTVEVQVVGAIDRGWLALVGVAKGDNDDDARWIADRIVGLRAFPDADGKMNRSVAEISGAVLVVSQFTLLADCRKGRRPGFDAAAPPDEANRLYRLVAAEIAARGVPVAYGQFGAMMAVDLCNDGPVTFVLERGDGGAGG